MPSEKLTKSAHARLQRQRRPRTVVLILKVLMEPQPQTILEGDQSSYLLSATNQLNTHLHLRQECPSNLSLITTTTCILTTNLIRLTLSQAREFTVNVSLEHRFHICAPSMD